MRGEPSDWKSCEIEGKKGLKSGETEIELEKEREGEREGDR